MITGVWCGKLLTKFFLPQVRRVHAQFARGHLDQPLDHEGRLRPARAAIGIDRRGVGVDRVDLAIDRRGCRTGPTAASRRDRSAPTRRTSTCRRRGWRSSSRCRPVILPSASNAISACVTWSRPCASVRKASERSEVHFTGPVHLVRGPEADDLFGIDEDLGAETAADIRRDHAQLVLRRHADEGRDHEPRDVRVLAVVFQSVQRVVARVVVAERRARLHRVRHQPVVDESSLVTCLAALNAASVASLSPRCQL